MQHQLSLHIDHQGWIPFLINICTTVQALWKHCNALFCSSKNNKQGSGVTKKKNWIQSQARIIQLMNKTSVEGFALSLYGLQALALVQRSGFIDLCRSVSRQTGKCCYIYPITTTYGITALFGQLRNLCTYSTSWLSACFLSCLDMCEAFFMFCKAGTCWKTCRH